MVSKSLQIPIHQAKQSIRKFHALGTRQSARVNFYGELNSIGLDMFIVTK